MGVDRLRGVGPRRLEAMGEVGIGSLWDLLTHYPRRYVDRSRQKSIRELTPGEDGLVLGTVRKAEARRTRQGRTMVEVDVGDGSGFLKVTFFNQPWRVKQLRPGQEVAVFGKVDVFRGSRRMTNPVVDLIGSKTGRIVPLYPQSEKSGLTTWDLGGFAAASPTRCLQRCSSSTA